MPLPDDMKKFDEAMEAMIVLCDVMNRQLVAIASICRALKSDGPKTFTLPDPPAHLMEQIAALVPKK